MDQLTSAQVSEWEAYDRLDPIGTWRDDFRMAQICSLVYNLTIAVHGKKGTKQTTAGDFMPNWTGDERPVKKQSVEEMIAVMTGIASSQNKKVSRDKKLGIQPSTPNKKKA